MSAEENKYEEIVEYIYGLLDERSLKPGSKLPSVRMVAQQFGCSVATVVRAYEHLRLEGTVYSKPKSGFIVMDIPNRKEILAHREEIDFASASPDEDGMPYQEYRHCLTKAVFLNRHKMFDYNDPQGLPSLRKLLANHLQKVQIFTKFERIHITSGAQQALFLLADMPFPNGKTNVLVEQPAYHGMLRTLELLNVRTLGIERTENGVDMEELERHFRSNSIKCFYTVPRFHNPTGWSYSKEQRKQIVRLASKYDVYVIEDDYLADLETDSKAEPMLAADGAEFVVYLKSFSKVMLPGLRLCLAVVPDKLAPMFSAYKTCADLGTSFISQNALELYMHNGLYDYHTERMRKLYSERMEALRSACAFHLPDGFVPTNGGGIFASLVLPGGMSAKEVVRLGQREGIRLTDAGRCFMGDNKRDDMVRLSIIRTGEARIQDGIERLSRILLRMSRIDAGRSPSNKVIFV
ncbi:aminotransferase-like domain-containing protein [Paenibacillus alkalitolerans]|uniref:aminotransferase-like domain-containing protein n=1 Tax=Paenibacillus alkalitolerans TaxID=2799335 RepID=UPI0018F5FC71|nr:PLP-dependent aminotransferase family protein [Paenibacillus alkalitolerans]